MPPRVVNARVFAHRFGAKLFDASSSRGELLRLARNLLLSRSRLPLKAMARLSPLDSEAATQLFCQTKNLSRSGMLVVTQSRFPIGSRVRFVIALPEGGFPVQGQAEVVRHTNAQLESTDGIGVRFARFDYDGEQRLTGFLERRRH